MESRLFSYVCAVATFLFITFGIGSFCCAQNLNLNTRSKVSSSSSGVNLAEDSELNDSNKDPVQATRDGPSIIDVQAPSCRSPLLPCYGVLGNGGCYSTPNTCDRGVICASGGQACWGQYGRPHCYYPASGNTCYGGLSCNYNQSPCLPPSTKTPHCVFSGQTCH